MSKLVSQDSGNLSGPARSPEYLRRFFLARLERVVAVRRERAPLLEAGSMDLRLLDKAVYSTYCDCLDLGASKAARAILRGEDSAAPETPEVDPN